MKKLPPNVFSSEIWQEIELVFRRHDLECLPIGASSDGLDPLEVEATKHGVEIRGCIWFLISGQENTNPRFEMNLCLSRPRFSSIQSVTAAKLEEAVIEECSLIDGFLEVVAG